MKTGHSRRTRLYAVLVAGAVLAVSCGSDDKAATSTEAPAPAESSPAAATTPAETTAAESTPAESAAPGNAVEEIAPPGGFITDFVEYTKGTDGPADMSLPPVKIGWSSNDKGGTVESTGPQATEVARIAVKWLNEHAGGIGGHPVVLDECPVLNAEEEGQACAQRFLADDQIKLIEYGALATGATTLNAAVDGKKPIIIGFSVNNPDIKAKNLYALFAAGQFATYAYGTFATQPPFNAKKIAMVYIEEPGAAIQVQGTTIAAQAGGITDIKAVPIDREATDLLGAYTAAGAQDADLVLPFLNSPAQCLASAKALDSLGVDPAKVIWRTYCNQPDIRSEYPGGDYPKSYATVAQSGDGLAGNPTGQALQDMLTLYGAGDKVRDPWYAGITGQILTTARFLNTIGYDNLSTDTIIQQVKDWKGPQLLGGTQIQCGRFTFAPANCTTGAYLFRYLGDDKWERVSQWTQPPEALLTYLEGLPADGDFPLEWTGG